jgi:hypothetical protein
MSGSGTREYFMPAGVACRIARRLEEDTVYPQVGRKHDWYRNGEYFMRAGAELPGGLSGGWRRIPRIPSPHRWADVRIGNEGEYFLQAGVSWRFVRKMKDDTFFPQMGRRTCQG